MNEQSIQESVQQLPVGSPLSGFFWTWVVPVVLFSIAFTATWLLYRHFASKTES